MKAKKPNIPRVEFTTVRQAIMALLESQFLSAREISAAVHIPEKEVAGHLEHIRAALRKEGRRLSLTAAVCMKCGFAFRKRDRLTRPGKCPVCRNEQIADPLYGIE